MKGNIYINGLIGTIIDSDGFVIEKGVELLDVIMQVKNQPKAESFNVYINSPGGVVTTGFEIYDYLMSLGKPIKTIGQELVGSIATVIFMAGSERELRSNTDFVIHLPSGGVNGNSEDISEYAQMIKGVEKKILKFYEEKTQLNETAILPLLQKETFLDASEAYKLGFATVKPEQHAPVAYFNTNKNETKMSKKENKSVWNQFKEWAQGKNILNKIVFTADQKELDFYELEDDDTIAVGAKARVDGQDANGEYSVPTEENPEMSVTYVFASGELTEIKEPETEEETEEDTTDEMAAKDAEIERLKTELQEAQNSVTEKETLLTEKEEKITNLKAKNKTFKEAIDKIKDLENEVPQNNKKEKTPKPETEAKVSAASKAIANLKNK